MECFKNLKNSPSSETKNVPPSSSEEEQLKKLINLVIECKNFIRNLNSEGAEGSFLDILSFMEKPEKIFEDLKKIFDLSKIQSKKLDEAILEKIFKEHVKNRIQKNTGKVYKNAIVEGAGPIGLYATYKLFMEGMNVTVINDRSENYIRTQLVIFDRKWVSQMRLFFGTEFDKLFFEKDSVGKMLDDELVLISIKDMEIALMERLKKVSNYVENKEKEKNDEEKSFLNLIYEIAVLDIVNENY
ncbi:hypothetical protein ACQ4LE_006413, partial [Meloidogyne hapla]